MRPAALLLLALPLLHTAPAAAAKMAKETLTFKGQERRYALYVPDRLPDGKVPLVVILPEARGDADALVGRWRKQADEGGFILAGVDPLNAAAWSLVTEPPGLIRQVVDALAAKLPIDPRRVYLFGNREGGYHAMSLTMIESEYFAAVSVHAASYQPGGYAILDLAKRKIPIQVLIGNQEQNLSLRMETVRGMEAEMAKRGIPVQVDVLRGHDNYYPDMAARINQQSWDFLSKQALAGDPVFRDPELQIQVQH